MAYPKHNFIDGQILYAQPLNEMDDQIALNEQKMDRVVYHLSQSGTTWQLKDENDNIVDFQSFYDSVKDETHYVVVLMGNNKLRPQYVSTNEIHAVSEDRDAQSSFQLRMVMTPTTLTYARFNVADKSDLDLKQNDVGLSIVNGLLNITFEEV